MKKQLQLLLAIGCMAVATRAQVPGIDPCGQLGLLSHLDSLYPGFKANYEKNYKEQAHPKNIETRKVTLKDTWYTYDTTFTIQVVFHILYNVASENINDSLVYNQMEVLNKCYRHTNPDTGNLRAVFKPRAGDTRLNFVLASKDPNGNATNGIVHKFTTKTSFESGQYADEMKFSSKGGDDAWDPAHYFNVWVCDMRYFGTEGLLGYAFPPYGQPNWDAQYWIADNRQGVALLYKIVGRNNPLSIGTLANSNQGKVLVHEAGHYFGLRHISGDPSSTTRCQVDDYIDDTPKQGYQSNFDCNTNQNSCTEANDLPDMVENYMDYSNHQCQNMFTKHQVNVIRLGVTKYRTQLPLSVEIDTFMHIKDTVLYNDMKVYVTSGHRIYFEINNANLLNGLKADLYSMTGQAIVRDYPLSANENYMSTLGVAPGMYVIVLRDKYNKRVLSPKNSKVFIQTP